MFFYAVSGVLMNCIGQVPYGSVVSHWFDRRRDLALGLMMFGIGSGARCNNAARTQCRKTSIAVGGGLPGASLPATKRHLWVIDEGGVPGRVVCDAPVRGGAFADEQCIAAGVAGRVRDETLGESCGQCGVADYHKSRSSTDSAPRHACVSSLPSVALRPRDAARSAMSGASLAGEEGDRLRIQDAHPVRSGSAAAPSPQESVCLMDEGTQPAAVQSDR